MHNTNIIISVKLVYFTAKKNCRNLNVLIVETDKFWDKMLSHPQIMALSLICFLQQPDQPQHYYCLLPNLKHELYSISMHNTNIIISVKLVYITAKKNCRNLNLLIVETDHAWSKMLSHPQITALSLICFLQQLDQAQHYYCLLLPNLKQELCINSQHKYNY